MGKSIKIRDLGLVVGLVISFGLALGQAKRFHVRLSTMEVA